MRIRPPGADTDLLKLNGGFFLSIQTQGGFELKVFATAELSFGVGSAQLTFGKATALLIVNEDGVAGSIKVSAGGGIGHARHGAVPGHRQRDRGLQHDEARTSTFVLPARIREMLIKSGETNPGDITIFASAPGLDGSRSPSAPPGGEIYVKAIVDAGWSSPAW